jgi:hypothetical protein
MTYEPEVRSGSNWIAMSAATRGPWKTALFGGVIVGAADFGLHLITLHAALATPLSYALAAFFLIGGAGALLKSGRDRAQDWALAHPMRFALVPGAGTAATVFAIRLLMSFGNIFGAFGHALMAGLAVTVLVAVIGYVARAVRH